jgi:hypothetical protein
MAMLEINTTTIRHMFLLVIMISPNPAKNEPCFNSIASMILDVHIHANVRFQRKRK